MQDWTELRVVADDVAMKDPVVLIQGLPGLGFVGKICADYMIEELHAKKLAELHSSYLTMPDGNVGVHVSADGTYHLPKYEFYAHTENSPALLLLTGNTQPITFGQVQVAAEVLNFAVSVGCRRVVALGGFQSVAERGPETVYGVFSSQQLAEEVCPLGVNITKNGAITGACGVLLGLALQRNLESIGLLGVTSGEYPDMEAAKDVLRVLSKFLKVDINLDSLDSRIEEMRAKMEQLRKTQSEIQARRTREFEKPPFYV
ncbi:MAG: PAC2 family protein [Candidatus Bathyarchaeia archaeon]